MTENSRRVHELSDTELAGCCEEIIRWHKTGIYRGEILESLANVERHGDSAMRIAESDVTLEVITRYAAEHRVDLEETAAPKP